MQLSFKSKKEQEFYESKKALVSRFGMQMAKKIAQRLGELQAATNPQKLPSSARFHEHQGSRKGLFSVDLIHPFRLIVEPTCKYTSWVEIISLKIYEVMDPH